ncbi:putative GTP binding domain, P-loop containing nucleoside triphosphate hydrolase [Plasmopara halstedii]
MSHGALQRLPYVRTAAEILEMKFWRASVSENNRIVDPIKRAKNYTSRCINMQLKNLSDVTRQTSLAFPALRCMHPFEREVVVLTLGEGTYEKSLQKLREVYATLHKVGKHYELDCQGSRTKKEAFDWGFRCVEGLKNAVDSNTDTLIEVANMAKMLRGLPHVDLDKPIFAFVGAPNVGKSSLVRALSTASPEVANYPFTTRGITMGHIFVEGISYQIADTPGLINRPNESRNSIEKLAIAMIEKTQASIGYVFDPTGSSGTSTADQILLRDELRHRVAKSRPGHKWIDIVSKIDQPSADQVLLQQRLKSSPHHLVSSHTNEGLLGLSDRIREVLTEDV